MEIIGALIMIFLGCLLEDIGEARNNYYLNKANKNDTNNDTNNDTRKK